MHWIPPPRRTRSDAPDRAGGKGLGDLENGWFTLARWLRMKFAGERDNHVELAATNNMEANTGFSEWSDPVSHMAT